MRDGKTRLTVGAMIGAIACCTLYPTSANGQPLIFSTDYFLCYSAIAVEAGATVQLQDQFQAANPFLVGNPIWFCDPVRVDEGRGAPITNRESNLTLYRIRDLRSLTLTPTREVVIQNVFGKDTIRIFQEELLGVPTMLFDGGIPTEAHDLDHFKCYRADGRKVGRSLTLEDRYQRQEHVQVGFPFSFCNPAEKSHNGVVTPILHPDDPLVCYLIPRSNPFGGNAVAFIDDQFDETLLVLEESNRLCVPTKTLNVSDIN